MESSKEELQKLTVTQLKDKLKQRKLPVAGTKAELVDRLFESYEEEEKLLAGGETDLNEEVLLGTSSLTEPNEEALLLGLTSKTTAQKPADATKPAPAAKPPVAQPKPATEVKSPPSAAATPANAENATEKPTPKSGQPKTAISGPANNGDATKPAAGGDAKPARVPIRPRISVEETDEAKKRRAERFGLLNQKSEETTEKSDTKTKAAAPADKHPISLNSNSKLLERAKRFGLPVQADDNNGVSKPKVARVLSSDEDAKKQARQQRFAR